MARSSWSGSIIFAGFPLPVKAYNLTSKGKDEGFKTLCKCHGQPIAQKNTCATDGTILTDVDKGVELGNVYHAFAETTVDQINGVGKTVALEVEQVCPVATLDLAASLGGFSVVAEDGKGADKPVAILWGVLRKTELAIVSRWTMRAGSRDAIVAIHAGPKGLIANTLPFAHQLSSAPMGDCAAWSVAVSDGERAMFEQALTTLYTVGDYQAATFVSEHNARRKTAIDAAVAGTPIAVMAPATEPAVPDLMAALAASLQAAGATPVAAPLAVAA